MKKILITGAAGFIGSHLARALLSRGNAVVGIDNFSDYYPRQAKEFNVDLTNLWAGKEADSTPESELKPIADLFSEYYGEPGQNGEYTFYDSDIRDSARLDEIFAQHKPEVVIHLAAMAGVGKSVEDPVLYTDVNILGTVKLLDISRKHSVQKFLFGSSSSVYGESNKVPFSEEGDVDFPVNPYAATKRMQEIFNYTYNYLFDIPIINIRIFGPIYGPLQRPYRMLAQRFINQTYHNEPMTIFGDGSEGGRDTTYIDDEVDGIIAAMESKLAFDTINIGSGRVVTPKQVADLVIELMGKGEITYLDRPKSETEITSAGTKKAESTLGFKAKWEFKAGLERQVETFMLMPDWYKNMPS